MIIYGTQYYRPPYPYPEDWENDLIKIKQSNFNTVKLWAVWSWIERTEGNFYYKDLDTLVDLCTQLELNIVINTIPEGMPYWASKKHVDAKYTTNEGLRVEVSGAANMPSGGSPGVCQDKFEVSELICRFISKTVERYAKQQRVIAFDVWNEPHIEPIWDYPNALFCYCEYSKAKFIAWLKEKYSTIDNLNDAWARTYTKWDEILPPVRFGTYPDMIDWRMFWLTNLGYWLDRRVEAARDVANGKIIMTHVPFSGYIGGTGDGGLGQHLGDEFILAQKVDKFGLTSFPKWLMQNDFIQHLVNIEMIASASKQKDFWQCELQSGAGKWEAYGRPVALPEEIRLWNWSSIAGGAKGVMFWQWKPEPSGTESPGFGLTTIDGELSERTKTAANCAYEFNKHEYFDLAHRVLPRNGIFVSRSTDLLLHAANQGETIYAKGLFGAYKACFEEGIPVRMVHADQVIESTHEDLDVLYAPVPLALSNKEQDSLSLFVEKGGTLICEACPGLFDEKGILQKQWGFLKNVFGLSKQEVDKAEKVAIRLVKDINSNGDPLEFFGRYYRQNFLEIGPDVKVLATFDNEQPAICEHQFGKGHAIWIGSLPSLSVALNNEFPAMQVIGKWMNANGYDQIISKKQTAQTLVRMHSYQNILFLTLVNYAETESKVEIRLNGNWNTNSISPDYSITNQDSFCNLSVMIKPRNGMIIKLESE